MFVGEEIELPRIITTDATPVRLGKKYLCYDAVTHIEAVILAGDPVDNSAATWRLQWSYALCRNFNVPYPLGAGVISKQLLADGNLWDATIIETWEEENDTPAKFWFQITGQAARTIVWGGRARIWTLDISP